MIPTASHGKLSQLPLVVTSPMSTMTLLVKCILTAHTTRVRGTGTRILEVVGLLTFVLVVWH